jgi:hypothetical protein
MKITLKERKPRNHLVALMSKRNGSGAHDKSHKAKRRSDKVKLQRECGV